MIKEKTNKKERTVVEEVKVCKDCKFYTQPKCRKHNKFTARKSTCDDYKK